MRKNMCEDISRIMAVNDACQPEFSSRSLEMQLHNKTMTFYLDIHPRPLLS